jgi:sulfatase modifying factor 1
VVAALAAALWLSSAGRAAGPQGPNVWPGMVRVPAGSYTPLYAQPAKDGTRTTKGVGVAAFDIDVRAVNNAEFLAFVRQHPEWRRSQVKALLADSSYLHLWAGDLELGPDAPPASPVVYVSWFAARAYLKAAGKQLPTVDQWEYVGAASATTRDASRDPFFLEQLRQWYGRPTPPRLPAVASGARNVYGVYDMHGLIWEWTLDFNSSLVTGESRADSALERTLYCGSGAAGASDFENYPAFMRYAFRSSLEAHYTVANLGFRGARAIEAH